MGSSSLALVPRKVLLAPFYIASCYPGLSTSTVLVIKSPFCSESEMLETGLAMGCLCCCVQPPTSKEVLCSALVLWSCEISKARQTVKCLREDLDIDCGVGA